jgi:ubiquinone/menaquinone biosynthesis C-methylase UbiE
MKANSADATLRNLRIEGVSSRCEVLSQKAEAMEFTDGSFDVVVSNLCLHNIYDKTARANALEEIARVLRPGGVALLSDYKLTGEYAQQLSSKGFAVRRIRNWHNAWMTFPPLVVVEARKPTAAS